MPGTAAKILNALANATFTDWVTVVSGAVTIFVFLRAGFERFAWRWPGVRRLVSQPDLGGTWHGHLRPRARNLHAGSALSSIEVTFIVHQTHGQISLTMTSAESRSVTVVASLAQDAPGEWAVIAAYRSEPNLEVRENSPIHFGCFRLRVINASTPRLAGHYWTDRATSGEIDVALLTRQPVNDFSSACQLAHARDPRGANVET